MEYPRKSVIPAKAGIHGAFAVAKAKWIPAYAGMTAREGQAMRQVQRGSQVMHCQEARRERLLAVHPHLQFLKDQTLQILAFGKMHGRRMIGGRT